MWTKHVTSNRVENCCIPSELLVNTAVFSATPLRTTDFSQMWKIFFIYVKNVKNLCHVSEQCEKCVNTPLTNENQHVEQGGRGALATVRCSCQVSLAQVSQISRSCKSVAGFLLEPIVPAGSWSRLPHWDGAWWAHSGIVDLVVGFPCSVLLQTPVNTLSEPSLWHLCFYQVPAGFVFSRL